MPGAFAQTLRPASLAEQSTSALDHSRLCRLRLGIEFWKRARVVVPPGKTSVHLRVDSDVFEWFKKQGEGHLTRMNAVLRSYVDAHRR